MTSQWRQVRPIGLAAIVMLVVLTADPAVLFAAEEEHSYHLLTMHTHPWSWDVVGAAGFGWVIGIVKGFSGSRDWLEHYWATPPRLLIFLLDGVVFVVVGGYLGTDIYNPTTFYAALAAGVSWPIGLGSLVTKDKP